jgi:hypothetical protein
MLAEISLVIVAFLSQSWVPATVALGGIILSVVEIRLGESIVRVAVINYASRAAELELDKRRKSGYN